MNDRFYNSPPLWGPKNGAGGDLGGKTDERLLEDAARIHSVYNYLDADLYSELVQKHFGGEKDAEKDKNDPTATNGLTTIHGVPSSNEPNSKDVSDGENVADFGEQSEHYNEQPTKKAKLRDNETTSDLRLNELKTIQAGDDGSAEQPAPSPTVTASAKNHPTCIKLGDDGSAEQQAPSPTVTASADYDPTCKDCVQPTRDPNTQELVMFLHALRYSGPDFDFSTPLPDWAEETWSEEEKYRLY